MQLLTPPENVELKDEGSALSAPTETPCMVVQIPIHPNG